MALQYDSNNPDIYFQLGQINQSIKNYNEAISQYKKAIERDTNPAFYYYLAECYAEINNIFEEKKALIECVKYDNQNYNAHYKLAKICKSQNDIQGAISGMRKALELNNNFIDAKYGLAILLELKGQKDEAINLYEEILAINPEHKEAIDNLKMLKPQS